MSERSREPSVPSWVADPRWVSYLSPGDREEAESILMAMRIRGFVNILDKMRLHYFFIQFRKRKYKQLTKQDEYRRSYYS